MRNYTVLTQCRDNGSCGSFEYCANSELEARAAAVKQLGHAYDVVKVIVDEYDAHLEKLFGAAQISTSDWCGEITVSVTFTMLKAEWDKLKKQGQLGGIYARDLSNYLSRTDRLNFYAVPTVSDVQRAKNGIKTINVRFTKRSN